MTLSKSMVQLGVFKAMQQHAAKGCKECEEQLQGLVACCHEECINDYESRGSVKFD